MGFGDSTGLGEISVEWPLGRLGRCVVLHGFLSNGECDDLIAKAEKAGFSASGTDYPPSYRDNDRLVLDDPTLANALFYRLQSSMHTSTDIQAPMMQGRYSASGVNKRLRFCRYRAGTAFRAHQDGVRHDEGSESRLTFMVYLNEAEFTGGDTLFFANRSDAMAEQRSVARVRPRKGSLILFDHAIWHSGSTVESGVKYVMRSDLMYPALALLEVTGPYKPGHRGYVWSLTTLADGGLASSGRDAVIRLWNSDGKLQSSLIGHTQSVLGVIETSRGVLVSYSRDRTVRRWRTAGGRSDVLGASPGAVLSGVQLDSRRIVTGDASGALTYFDAETGATSHLKAHASWVWSIARCAPDVFATVAEDGWVRVWRSGYHCPTGNVQLGFPLRSVAALEQEERRLAVGDCEGHVYLLRLEGSLPCETKFKAHDGAVRKVRFLDHNHLLSCGEDGAVIRWDITSGERILLGTHDNFASDVVRASPDGWASCGYDGEIRVGRLPPE